MSKIGNYIVGASVVAVLGGPAANMDDADKQILEKQIDKVEHFRDDVREDLKEYATIAWNRAVRNVQRLQEKVKELTDVDFLNAAIAEFKLAVDENKLHQTAKLLSQNSSPIQQKELQIIEKVFLADLISQKVDSLNQKSTNLYLQVSHQIENSKNIPLQIWVHTKTGFYLYSYNQYIQALPYFLKSSRALEQINDEELFDAADILKNNAYFFSTTFEI